MQYRKLPIKFQIQMAPLAALVSKAEKENEGTATAKPTRRLANLRSVWQLKQEPEGWKRSALSGRAVAASG